MRVLPWITCLWPGLTRLWLLGQWRGLFLAVGFGVLLNGALVGTFVWNEAWPLEPNWVAAAGMWVLVLGLWSLGVRGAIGQLSTAQPNRAEPSPQLDQWFREAQAEYLKGHWFEAETLLDQILAKNRDDAEARLLLSSVMRRTKRFELARRNLTRLSAAKWAMEVEGEMRQIEQGEEEQQETMGFPELSTIAMPQQENEVALKKAA